MSEFDERDFFDETDYEGVGERQADTHQALRCIEEALNILACCGKGKAFDEITELLNRAFNLIDRHYGEDEVTHYIFELDFNDDDEDD